MRWKSARGLAQSKTWRGKALFRLGFAPKLAKGEIASLSGLRRAVVVLGAVRFL
jgi:hypothetical protein